MSTIGTVPITVDPIAALARQVADLTARLEAAERRIESLEHSERVRAERPRRAPGAPF